MKALLLHPERDFDPKAAVPRHHQALTQDLALDVLLHAMAGDDALVQQVARVALLTGPGNDRDTVLYRQAILRDCLANPDVVRELYALVNETLDVRRRHWFGIFGTYPPAILHGAIDMMQLFAQMLLRFRRLGEVHGGRFQSDGMRRLFAMLQQEFDDAYLARIAGHLEDLKFRGGVLIGAALGDHNQGTDWVLRPPPSSKGAWLAWLFRRRREAYTVRIDPRDEAGARALGDLHDRGINLVANAMAQSAEHVLSFFEMLRIELAFYIGSLNLAAQLRAQAIPVCFPEPAQRGTRTLHFRELKDACLALTMGRAIVGNSVDGDGRSLVLITGANQGGKSSFLRAAGLAQVMMQAGLFVTAESFAAEICTGLFTHFRREEDATMKKGKLDEELGRLSDLADAVGPDAVVLFNESFAATNEREGAEIARQVVGALLDKRVRVLFVTHLYEFAHGLAESPLGATLFLRAERLPDGTRTFRLIEGPPLLTSYGDDLYREVFGSDAEAAIGA
jgi:DNA mismatch repair ATPase MutS